MKRIKNKKYGIILALGITYFILIYLVVSMFQANYGVRNPFTRSIIYHKTGDYISPLPTATHSAVQKPTTLLPKEGVAHAEAPVLPQSLASGQELNNKILAISPHTESWYKLYIYQHESGSDPKKVNSRGCVGLGQDCNGVLVNLCPALDYSCEDDYFSNTYLKRYHYSWKEAYEFGMSKGTPGRNDGWGWW